VILSDAAKFRLRASALSMTFSGHLSIEGLLDDGLLATRNAKAQTCTLHLPSSMTVPVAPSVSLLLLPGDTE